MAPRDETATIDETRHLSAIDTPTPLPLPTPMEAYERFEAIFSEVQAPAWRADLVGGPSTRLDRHRHGSMRGVGRVPSFDPQTQKGPWFNTLAWAARQRPVTWFLVNVGNRIDPYLMRATGGRVKSTINAPTVLLTHTGGKSGKRRTTPLAYFTDGDDVILIASRGGHRHHPAWYHNVTANPEVELWTKGGGGRYRANEADGSERQRLWGLATGFYPGFARYQERARGRRIPVIVCSPQD